MTPRYWLLGSGFVLLLWSGCASKQAAAPPPPPPPKQNIVALLAEPDGKAGRIVVTNAGGSQEVSVANQAVSVLRSDTAPSTPYTLDQQTIRRLFGTALDALPPAEVQFVLYFDEGKDDLNPASLAELPAIARAVQDRRSTAVSVIGHTDTTGDPQSNYRLGMRRAQRVAAYLRHRGLEPANLFVDSHGEADLLVKTPQGQAEPRNRRVEVIVR